MNEYAEQAENFLTATGTEFNCEFLKNDFHFSGDTEKRDIYKITLSRDARKMKIVFGQSLANSGFYYTKGRQKIELERELLTMKNLPSYIRRKDFNFLNNGKSDKIHYPIAPNSYDVLACLQKYDPETFEDFCNEFGYDQDSRTAKKVYKAVKKEYNDLCTLFSDSEIEQLQEIQ